MKVFLETLGCQMNVLDSELVVSLLRSAGMEPTADPRQADVLLYNTCSVRQHAEDKVHSRLGWACRRKADGRRLVIGVLGCMAQRLRDELVWRHPGVDIVCGPGQLGDLVEMIRAAAAAESLPWVAVDPARPSESLQPLEDQLDGLRDPAATHLPGQAYVRIMRGCDKFCSYCVVPHVRGRERSRPPEGIVEEVRRLVGAGVTQVTLLGQTVSSYRHRAGEVSVGLAELLARLDGLDGLRRIRFLTSYPADFDRAILAAMGDLPKVCEYLHLPAQSGSDRVLKAMNRRYTRGEYDDLVDAARAAVPGLALAGDFIVGFPGETDEDFAASAELARRSEYKNSYIFQYSTRPGTAAARRAETCTPPVKRSRNRELLAVQEEVSLAVSRRQVGAAPEVLVEGPSPRSRRPENRPARPGTLQMVGRTRADHIVVFDGTEDLAGQYVRVQITAATALTLFGHLAEA